MYTTAFYCVNWVTIVNVSTIMEEIVRKIVILNYV